MGQRLEKFPVSGLQNGLNTESSTLSSLAAELNSGSFNIDVERNGTMTPRRGVDTLGNEESTVRSNDISGESYHDSPNAIPVELRAPNNSTVSRVIVAINNTFRVYISEAAFLRDPDNPEQTISLGSRAAPSCKYYPTIFSATDSRVYFVNKFCQPGYLYVDTDNITLLVGYLDGYTRVTGATTAGSRVTRNGKWFEALQAHTSSATTRPDDGTGNWQRYWQQLDGPVPAGTSAWANSTAYTSTITNAFDSTVTMTDLTPRPDGVETFAGRVWLSFGNTIYYSQVIPDSNDSLNLASRFHQFADPASTTDSEPVDSDGGTIPLTGYGQIKQLLEVGRSIFIGTTQGVAQISGPNGIFSATNYSINRVLKDESVIGPFTMASVDQRVMLWGESSVWLSEKEPNSVEPGSVRFEKISIQEQRVGDAIRTIGIQSQYNQIPSQNKASGRAVYHAQTSTVYFFHNQSRTDFQFNYGALENPGYYTAWYKYDIVKNRFTLHTINDGTEDDTPYIASPFVSKAASFDLEDVTVGGETVTAGGGTVTVEQFSGVSAVLFVGLRREIDGVTTVNQKLHMFFGRLETANTIDWATTVAYNVTYNAVAKTGVNVLGDLGRKKSTTYINFLFDKVESGVLLSGVDTTPGGCLLSVAHNYATSSSASKYSSQKQIYHPYRFGQSLTDGSNDGHNKVWYKHRVRGSGMAIQLIFEKDGAKDFRLEGWGQNYYRKRALRAYRQT